MIIMANGKPGAPKGKKQSSHYYAAQRRLDREHEFQIAIINAMAADPELKYFLGVAGGAAVGVLGSIAAGTGIDTKKSDATAQAEADAAAAVPAGPFGWIIQSPGVKLATGVAETIAETTNNISTNPFAFMGVTFALAGTGFAGFCSAVLILKTIFGDEDVATLAQGLGSMLQGAIPL